MAHGDHPVRLDTVFLAVGSLLLAVELLGLQLSCGAFMLTSGAVLLFNCRFSLKIEAFLLTMGFCKKDSTVEYPLVMRFMLVGTASGPFSANYFHPPLKWVRIGFRQYSEIGLKWVGQWVLTHCYPLCHPKTTSYTLSDPFQHIDKNPS